MLDVLEDNKKNHEYDRPSKIRYIIRRLGDDTWEWFIPSLNFGGRTESEAIAQSPLPSLY
jgi:hypothetical protein